MKIPDDYDHPYTEDDLEAMFQPELLAELSAEERVILERRFNLNEPRQHTLEEIGRIMGLTRERVRQLESQANKRLEAILGPLGEAA